MSEPVTCYTDIGHYPTYAFIWMLIDNRRIEHRSARKSTHEMTWGAEALNNWRGRYEPATKRVSVAPPQGSLELQSNYFYRLLLDHFGMDVEIWMCPHEQAPFMINTSEIVARAKGEKPAAIDNSEERKENPRPRYGKYRRVASITEGFEYVEEQE